MTILKHELRQGRISLIIWTVSIAFLMAVCIFLFPEMKGEMDEVSEIFSSMGSFSAAFGMDQVSFGTLPGFYAIECGNILGLGGAFFSALCAVQILAKEERDRTAEFLLTHPISRNQVLTGKLASVMLQIILLNTLVLLASLLSIHVIGEEILWKELLLLHLAYFLLQVEIAAVCFGLSAFLRRGSTGAGLGLAVILYFCSIIANISDSAEFLVCITPFGYADGPEIVTEVSLEWNLIFLGMIYAGIGIGIAYLKYNRKDIA